MKKGFIILALFACSLITAQQTPKEKIRGFDINNLDKSTSPGNDFYQYAVGNWLKNNPVPGDQSSWGSFNVLFEENNDAIKAIIDDLLAGKVEKSEKFEKLVTLFNSGMDTIKIEKEGYQPIKPYLARISKISSKKDFIKELAYAQVNTSAPLFNFYSEQDEKNSTMVILTLSQGGLGLPERDYYTNTDDESVETQSKYKEHIKNMFKLIGTDESKLDQIINSIYNIEKDLAEASFTNVELRDVPANYNKMSIDQLIKLSPNFDWKLFFNEAGISKLDEINVKQIKFFENLSKMVDKVSIDDWKNYLTWNLIKSSANYLSSPFVNEKFSFYGTYLQGAQVLQPRWKRVLGVIDGQIGEIMGELYVQRYFPAEAKQKASEIVKSLLTAMGERIENLSWMSDVTKKKALTKLGSFNYKIGYPDKWVDYSALKFGNISYFDNVVKANCFHTKKDLDKVGKPVDRAEWGMNPQTVNAYYNPVMNEIVFPAAILQPPFFDYLADDAINYGGMGAVIGHEITHGFDDQGRQYDFDGNMRDWWTKEDEEKFSEKTALMIEQFNNFVVVDTFKVNGELTLGENIADLGGLTVSYTAFKKSQQYKENKLIDGFTPSQRFFLSWAQIWHTNMTDSYAKMLIKVDVHSPAKCRVNGPLSNMPEFKEAFNLKDTDNMIRPAEKNIKIW